MSYILDALRRSQAERERGQVPGLDAHPLSAEPPRAARRRAWTTWLGAGIVAGLGLSAALWAWQQGAPGRDVRPLAVPAPTAQPAAPAPPLPVVVSVPPPAAVPAAEPAPTVAAPRPRSPAAVPARALALAELSAEERRELPPMTVGGSVYSDQSSQRFVIVNGQVVHEGESVAPGLVVERIGAKAFVLRWRERRIELPL